MKEIMSDLVFKIIELLHIILLNFMCINTTMYIINRNAELSSIKYVTFGNINNIECIPFGITLYLNRLSLLCVFPDNSRTYCKQPPKVRKLRGRLREVLAHKNRTTGGLFREEVPKHPPDGRQFIACNYNRRVVPCSRLKFFVYFKVTQYIQRT